jgi:hypothetical protein
MLYSARMCPRAQHFQINIRAIKKNLGAEVGVLQNKFSDSSSLPRACHKCSLLTLFFRGNRLSGRCRFSRYTT